MKTTLSLFIFLFLSTVAITAQEANTTSLNNKDQKDKTVTEAKENEDERAVCYSEISKVTFYEALIRQNNFDIQLKDSKDYNANLVLKNTEDIIKNNQERISYTD
ncbi:hypothetical protein M0D21_12465 [Aquimarina sp. D1M17]|uniref:hypothetical protein n=1 Tax=Aquimarina acroporae TaxID=2937283 RepID=UPI0020BECA51|nr:hypothetical protein [Aquimarina acroporae]MCK8522389.1 hypothetical protein [Aquimarina acroporae]